MENDTKPILLIGPDNTKTIHIEASETLKKVIAIVIIADSFARAASNKKGLENSIFDLHSFGFSKDHHNGDGYMASYGTQCLERSSKDKHKNKAPRARKSFNKMLNSNKITTELKYQQQNKIPNFKRMGLTYRN